MKQKIIRGLLALFALLPLWLSRTLGAMIGQCCWWLESRGAQTAVANIRRCFPYLRRSHVNQFAARSMRQWGKTLCETPKIWRTGSEAERWLKGEYGDSVLTAAQARAKDKGTGILFVCPHLGNWEYMGFVTSKLGAMTTLYQPPRSVEVEDILVNARTSTGVTLVSTDGRGVVSLIKALKRGELVGVLPDMEPKWQAGVFAPFFGAPALTMTLAHRLIKKTNTTVVFCAARRVNGGFVAEFLAASDTIYSDDQQTSVLALNDAVATLVERCPEQYQWEYKRFKRQPEGYPPVYRKKSS